MLKSFVLRVDCSETCEAFMWLRFVQWHNAEFCGDVGYRAAVFQFCLCKWQLLKMTGIVIFIFFMNIISSWEFWEMYSGLRWKGWHQCFWDKCSATMSSHDLDQERLNLSLKEDFSALLYRRSYRRVEQLWTFLFFLFFYIPPPEK